MEENVISYHNADGTTSTITTSETLEHIIKRKMVKLVTQLKSVKTVNPELTKDVDEVLAQIKSGTRDKIISFKCSQMEVSYMIDTKHNAFYIYKRLGTHLTVRYYTQKQDDMEKHITALDNICLVPDVAKCK